MKKQHSLDALEGKLHSFEKIGRLVCFNYNVPCSVTLPVSGYLFLHFRWSNFCFHVCAVRESVCYLSLFSLCVRHMCVCVFAIFSSVVSSKLS